MAEDSRRDPRRRSLFGGAMSIVLPAGFADVSDFRPVPDHQEVFADVDADASVVVEVMEPPDGDRVGTYYFHDIAEASGAEIDGAAVEEGFFPSADLTPAACVSCRYKRHSRPLTADLSRSGSISSFSRPEVSSRSRNSTSKPRTGSSSPSAYFASRRRIPTWSSL